jgi:hypothetical protein
LHKVLCGCWGLCVDPCGPRISMWTQFSKWTHFDDDDVSMIVTKTMTVTMTVYVDPVSMWTQFLSGPSLMMMMYQ